MQDFFSRSDALTVRHPTNTVREDRAIFVYACYFFYHSCCSNLLLFSIVQCTAMYTTVAFNLITETEVFACWLSYIH